MVYLLETLVWQKSKDAQKKTPQHKPKPFVPDFMAIDHDREVHTTDDIRDILAKPRV